MRCIVSTFFMALYKNKYRIESARLSTWDYAGDGLYFITICTKNREHFFGECSDGKMKLSTVGAIVQGFWFDIPNHFDNVYLGEFVVMPNHIHGILSVQKPEIAPEDLNNKPVDEEHTLIRRISPKAGSLPVVIGSFKSVCSKHIHKTFPTLNFAWQERYWDNIIRDATAHNTISEYILNNPKNWGKDKFY